eukprot:39434-Chlamydomonas_euryale.AAC.2
MWTCGAHVDVWGTCAEPHVERHTLLLRSVRAEQRWLWDGSGRLTAALECMQLKPPNEPILRHPNADAVKDGAEARERHLRHKAQSTATKDEAPSVFWPPPR